VGFVLHPRAPCARRHDRSRLRRRAL